MTSRERAEALFRTVIELSPDTELLPQDEDDLLAIERAFAAAIEDDRAERTISDIPILDELHALVDDGVGSHPKTDIVGAVKHIIKIRDDLFRELNAMRSVADTRGKLLEQARDEIKDRANAYAALRGECDALSADLAAAQAEIERLQARLRDRDAEISRLEWERNKLRDYAVESDDRLTTAETHNTTLETALKLARVAVKDASAVLKGEYSVDSDLCFAAIDAIDAALSAAPARPATATKSSLLDEEGQRVVAGLEKRWKEFKAARKTAQDDRTIFCCKTCDRSTWGWTDGRFEDAGWGRIGNIDGPNAICPRCQQDSAALDGLREDYPDAALSAAPARPATATKCQCDQFDEPTRTAPGAWHHPQCPLSTKVILPIGSAKLTPMQEANGKRDVAFEDAAENEASSPAAPAPGTEGRCQFYYGKEGGYCYSAAGDPCPAHGGGISSNHQTPCRCGHPYKATCEKNERSAARDGR